MTVLRRPQASPLRYPGGKGALYPLLRTLIRDNGMSGCTYVEPYAGGVGAGLALLLTGEVGKLVINDLDPAVYALWQTLVAQPSWFAARVKQVPLTVSEWRHQKAIYRDRSSASPEELGFATFYLNRTNRSGVLNGGPIGGLTQSGNYKIDARFNRDALAERIRAIGLFANRIQIENDDGVGVAKSALESGGSFVYADPPYFEKAGSLYLNSFKDKDHIRLAAMLNGFAAAPWVLTYDSCPQVSNLYSERRRREISLNYSAHRVMKAKEILVLGDLIVDRAGSIPQHVLPGLPG